MTTHEDVFKSIVELDNNYIAEAERISAADEWSTLNGTSVPSKDDAENFMRDLKNTGFVGEEYEEENDEDDEVVSFSSKDAPATPSFDIGSDLNGDGGIEEEYQDHSSSFIDDPLSFIPGESDIGDDLLGDSSDVFSSTTTGKFNFRTQGSSLSEELENNDSGRDDVYSVSTHMRRNREEMNCNTASTNVYSVSEAISSSVGSSTDQLSSMFDSLSLAKKTDSSSYIRSSPTKSIKKPTFVDQFKSKAEEYIKNDENGYRNNLAFVIVPSESALRNIVPEIQKGRQTTGFIRAHVANHLAPAKKGQSGITSTILVTGNKRQFRVTENPSDKKLYFFNNIVGRRRIGNTESVKSIKGTGIKVKYCHLAGERDTLYM